MLYQKPDYYDKVNNKKMSLQTLFDMKSEIEYVCVYKAQAYVCKHINKYSLNGHDIEDIIQEVITSVCTELNLFINKCTADNDVEDFWGYVSNWIKYNTIAAYRKLHKDSLCASGAVQRKAKKICDMMEDENLSVQDVSKKTGCKIDTVMRYQNICNPVHSLDSEDDAGMTGYDKLLKDDMTSEYHMNDIDKVYDILSKSITKEESFILKQYLDIRYKAGEKAWRQKLLYECNKKGISRKRTLSVMANIKEEIESMKNQ